MGTCDEGLQCTTFRMSGRALCGGGWHDSCEPLYSLQTWLSFCALTILFHSPYHTGLSFIPNLTVFVVEFLSPFPPPINFYHRHAHSLPSHYHTPTALFHP